MLDGDHSLKLFGQFNGTGNFSGVSQGISVDAGDVVRASASTFIDSLDSIAGTGNEVVMKIEFFDEFGGAFGTPDLIGESQILIADGSSVEDSWLDHVLLEPAPAGAEEARLVFYFYQPDDETGAVHLDQSLIEVVTSFAESDFDLDGDVDLQDLTIWEQHYGIDAGGDGSGNGITDGADFLLWQRQFSGDLSSFSATTAVPEPANCFPILFGLMMFRIQRDRRGDM